ncbi:BRCT domain-containing protein [Mycena indigotica]|uniref:BRCT domain-containing protein n=1 Tax=Mycena indigotica TaxID=2126181 RepID=A0A8H6TAJ7_9AGAR|nr:BRCT domain-containing protein [Mycena indigotica]KAF7315215.1 BRCT domain-containing protein [Mycena indigotica]
MDSKRPLTRSQLVVPDTILRSPLTAAKQRTYNDHDESEDEILLSPNKAKPRSKRSASPTPADGNAVKRLKFDPEIARDTENKHTRNNSEPFPVHSKPGTPKGRARSVPLLTQPTTTSSWQRRARSRSPSKEADFQPTFFSSLPSITESMPPPILQLPSAPTTPSTNQLRIPATPMSPLTPLPATPRVDKHQPEADDFPRTIGWGADVEEVRRIEALPAPTEAPAPEPKVPMPPSPPPPPPPAHRRETAESSRTTRRTTKPSQLPRPPIAGPSKAPSKSMAPPPAPSVLKKNLFHYFGDQSNAKNTKPVDKVMEKGKAKAEPAKKPIKGNMRAREKPQALPLPLPIIQRLPDEDDDELFVSRPIIRPTATQPTESTRSLSPLTDLEDDDPVPAPAVRPNDLPPLSPLTEPTDDELVPEVMIDDIPVPLDTETPPSPLTEPTDDDLPVIEDTMIPLPPPSSSPVEEGELDLPPMTVDRAGEEPSTTDIELPSMAAPAEQIPDPPGNISPPTIAGDDAHSTPATNPTVNDVVVVPDSSLQSKARPKSRVGKPRAPPPLPADRVTRSTSLKRKEVDDGPTQRTLISFGVGPAKMIGNPAKKQKMDAPPSPSKIPIPSPSKISSFASPTKASSARAAATRKKPVSAVAGPSSGSMSPAKNRLDRASSVFNTRPPPLFPRAFTEGSSSLQSLTTALERLRAPPPERPNTSLGFSRDDVETSLGESSKSVDDRNIGLGRPSKGALQRATTVASIPSRSSSSSSIAESSSAAATKTQLVQRPLTSFLNGKSGGTAKLAVGGGSILRGGAFSARGRMAPKVSRNPGLPSVMGSPVKGGTSGAGEGGDAPMLEEELGPPQADTDQAVERVTSPRSVTFDLESLGFEPAKRVKKKEILADWKSNASRRASMALHELSKSISLPIKPMGPPESPADRLGMRSSSSSYPSSSSSTDATGSVDVEGMRRSTRIAKAAVADMSVDEDVASSSTTPAPLTVLKGCVIFVDVISEMGDDSLRSLYSDTLKTLGARIQGSVGQTCTHIVYKNGLRSTYSKYKALSEPRPFLVGMEWVVKCAETKTRQDETPYLIDLDDMNTTAPKRRKTMMPLFGSSVGDDSMDEGHSLDISSNSIIMGDDLTPLERARQRKAAATLGAS